MRDAVVVMVELDVVVDVDRRALHEARTNAVAGSARDTERRALERRPATSRQLLERPGVEFRQQLRDRGIELGQAEERPMAQPGENPALDDLHAGFDLGLVLRLSRACRQDDRAVMGGELGGARIRLRLVAVGVGNEGARIVRDDAVR